MNSTVTIQKVTEQDLSLLLALSRETFFDAFAQFNTPEDMEAYASVAFQPQRLQNEFFNPGSSFYFALVDGAPAGYIKMNTGAAQTDLKTEAGLEVERIYVQASHQRKQIGNQLLNFAIETAITDTRPYIWLGVWDQNHQAIRFYERNGFKQFGSHPFMLGTDKQVDILMKREF